MQTAPNVAASPIGYSAKVRLELRLSSGECIPLSQICHDWVICRDRDRAIPEGAARLVAHVDNTMQSWQVRVLPRDAGQKTVPIQMIAYEGATTRAEVGGAA